MSNQYCGYMLTNKKDGTLYIGITNNMPRRIEEHQKGVGAKFTHRYNLTMLVWYEFYDDVREAIAREKQLKNWQRAWKIGLIEEMNPQWQDLSLLLNG